MGAGAGAGAGAGVGMGAGAGAGAGADAVIYSIPDDIRIVFDRSTLDARRTTVDARCMTHDARRTTLDARCMTLDARRSTLDTCVASLVCISKSTDYDNKNSNLSPYRKSDGLISPGRNSTNNIYHEQADRTRYFDTLNVRRRYRVVH